MKQPNKKHYRLKSLGFASFIIFWRKKKRSPATPRQIKIPWKIIMRRDLKKENTQTKRKPPQMEWHQNEETGQAATMADDKGTARGERKNAKAHQRGHRAPGEGSQSPGRAVSDKVYANEAKGRLPSTSIIHDLVLQEVPPAGSELEGDERCPVWGVASASQ